MRSAGLLLVPLALTTPGFTQGKPAEPAFCAPAMVVTALRQLMGSLRFAPDSTSVELVSSGSSDLGTRALRVSDPQVCRRAAAAYHNGLADYIPEGSTRTGTAVVRVGSYYFTYEAHSTLHVVLTDSRWKVLAILGFADE
jgi:hypothetical protein